MNHPAEIVQTDGFAAEVIRTNRKKTASVRVEAGKVSIVVPRTASQDSVQELIRRKTRWIQEKLLLQQDYQPPRPKEYVSGECFTYLGRSCYLQVLTAAQKGVRLDGDRLMVSVPESVQQHDKYIRKALVDWYRTQAQEILREKVAYYASIISVSPCSIKVRAFTARWGSCSIEGHLSFNWQIIMAPSHIVDYIVIHELCHLHHHNHSPAFWHCVARYYPGYSEAKAWLKENGESLQII